MVLADDVLRLSMDAKATVKIGPFSRGGKNRTIIKACDHDFKPLATVTPVGILLPEHGNLYLYCVTSKVTSDCLIDILTQWWQSVKDCFSSITTLVINLDNGPECQSRRTQFLKRIVEFAYDNCLTIRLAYYPPYHSKYNPIERCFGVLENHWNGDLLDSIETVVNFAATMRWKGKPPTVSLIETNYQTGISLTNTAMEAIEAKVKRLTTLEKWFIDIYPT